MIKYIILKILNIFDLQHQYKIFNFLKKNNLDNFQIILDVGAHKGESINLFLKNFKVKKIYSFESSPINFNLLKQNLISIKKKFINTEIVIENLTLGSENKEALLKQIDESSSSTLNDINLESNYFKKKQKLLYNEKKKNFYENLKINVTTLDEYLDKNKIKYIDFLKIDTEGYEYEVLKGLKKNINNIKLIMFEHHYDDMLNKGYSFGDIKELLNKNNFIQIFKSKMPFRKTFEYVYINSEKI
jgi:FkbM family methyltransferase